MDCGQGGHCGHGWNCGHCWSCQNCSVIVVVVLLIFIALVGIKRVGQLVDLSIRPHLPGAGA